MSIQSPIPATTTTALPSASSSSSVPSTSPVPHPHPPTPSPEVVRLLYEFLRTSSIIFKEKKKEIAKKEEETRRLEQEAARLLQIETVRVLRQLSLDGPYASGIKKFHVEINEEKEKQREWDEFCRCSTLPILHWKPFIPMDFTPTRVIPLNSGENFYSFMASLRTSPIDFSASSHHVTDPSYEPHALKLKNLSSYFGPLLDSLVVGEQVVSLLQDHSLLLRSLLPRGHYAGPLGECHDQIKAIRQLALQKFEFLSVQFLSRCDELEEEDTKTFTAQHCSWNQDNTKSASYGMWIHTSGKHGRIKKFEFDSLKFTVELPVALQKSRTGIRLIRTSYDPFNVEDTNTSTHFRALGGVIQLDQLLIPQQPKQAKGWTMREFHSNFTTITIVPYPQIQTQTGDNQHSSHSTGHHGPPQSEFTPPLSGTTSSIPTPTPSSGASTSLHPQQNQAPLRVTLFIDLHSLYWDPSDVPLFGWWDSKNSTWRTEGIQITQFDPDTGKVQLNLGILKPFAILQPRALDFPYNKWKLEVKSDAVDPQSSLHFSLDGSRFTAEIQILHGKCRLCSPRDHPVIQQLNQQWDTPSVLLAKLASVGINLTPTVQDALYCRKPLKSPVLMDSVHDQIAQLSHLFKVSSNAFSSSRGDHVVIVRLQVVEDGEIGRLATMRRVGERHQHVMRLGGVSGGGSSKEMKVVGEGGEESKEQEEKTNEEEGESKTASSPKPQWTKEFALSRMARPFDCMAELVYIEGLPVVKYSIIKGVDTDGDFCGEIQQGNTSHSNMKRAIIEYFISLFKASDQPPRMPYYPSLQPTEWEMIGYLLDLRMKEDGELEFDSNVGMSMNWGADQIVQQQAVAALLSLTMPLVFH